MIEKKLDCTFIRINPDAADFNISNAIYLVHRHIIKSSNMLTRKFVINEIRFGLAELSFEFEKKNAKTIR